MKKFLVIGCGFLGSHILNELKKLKFEAYGTKTCQKDEFLPLDITQIESIEKIIQKIKPKIVINCAARVDVDNLENNPDLAYSVNSYGPQNLAKILKKNKIKLIHISSDGIFDGVEGNYSEKDIPKPINIYGKSKLLGEELIQKNNHDFIIIRTNFYGNDKNEKFVFNWILNNLKQKKQIIGFDDVIFSPLEVSNLSRIIIELSTSEFKGIINLASDLHLSKFDFACKIAEEFSLEKKFIKKGKIELNKFLAKRPKNTSLKNDLMKSIIKSPVLSLSQSLKIIHERDF